MKYIQATRSVLKKIIPKSLIKKTRDRNALIKWYLSGQPVPPPDLIKQKLVRSTGKKENLRTLIETGTAGGLMLMAVKRSFTKIISIELDNILYSNAVRNFEKIKHIKLVHGDSGTKLTEILPTINEPALFWLDAHYSGEGTAKADVDTPIVKELLLILSRDNRNDVILIDDARCFDGTHDYPTIKQLTDLVSKYPHLILEVNRDIISIRTKK